MGTSARESAATKALLQQLDAKATGRLSVDAEAEPLAVYLMSGEVVAAVAPSDNRVLVHLLQRQGVLRRKVVANFERALHADEPIFGDLLKYAGAAIDKPLHSRFENNLAEYCGSDAEPVWQAERSVFVDNLQMGHDSRALIDRICTLWDRASALDLATVVENGAVPFEGDNQIWIAKAVGRGERPIGDILLDLPMEPLHARLEMLAMLDSGMITVAGTQLEGPDDLTDATEEVQAIADLDEVEELEVVEQFHDHEEAEEADTVYGVDISSLEPAFDADTVVEQPLPVPTPAGAKARSQGTTKPNTLDQWMEQMSSVDDDELDFFADHDHERGSANQGAFSTETHNLDRVEVIGMDESLADVIEVEEAEGPKFGAPVLGENEMAEKLAVANEALAHVVAAFDAAEGNGRGRAVVQLLVDGSPSKFSALFSDIAVGDDGALPDSDVIDNLHARPATEHRRLLNNGLVDIIERAISSAADELPDEQFENMYEAVAGYRQRLGL